MDESFRADFRAGVRAVLPVLVGIVPFGLVAGAAAVAAGLSGLQAVGLSVVVFAGASQLAAIGLFGAGANPLVVLATMLVINLRVVMYSASMAPHFRDVPARWRAVCAYVLADHSYALAVTRFRDADVGRLPYFLGTALPVWVVWQVCTVIGVVAGARVPGWLPLAFAVPLVFLALVVPAVEDAPTLAAAVVGGTVAVLAANVPFNLGLVTGALLGVAAGLLVESAVGAPGRREVVE